MVYDKNFGSSPLWITPTVRTVTGAMSYSATLQDERTMQRHMDQLREHDVSSPSAPCTTPEEQASSNFLGSLSDLGGPTICLGTQSLALRSWTKQHLLLFKMRAHLTIMCLPLQQMHWKHHHLQSCQYVILQSRDSLYKAEIHCYSFQRLCDIKFYMFFVLILSLL